MKILVISDTHFGYYFGKNKEARDRVINEQFDTFEKIIKVALDKKIDYIIHTGDIFNRSKPPKHIVKRTYAHFEQILEHGIGLLLVPGNHDRSSIPENLWSFFYDDFFIFNSLAKFKTEPVDFIGFPYSSDPDEQFNKALDMIDRPSIILCHQVFSGASFGPHNFTFYQGKDVLRLPNSYRNNPELLMVLTGHIHRHQIIQEKVVYTGSMLTTSFAEVIESKGVLLLELSNTGISFDHLEIQEIYPREVIEFDISKVDDVKNLNISVTKDRKILLRFCGRKLRNTELDYLRYTFRNYPMVLHAPNSDLDELKPLYNVK